MLVIIVFSALSTSPLLYWSQDNFLLSAYISFDHWWQCTKDCAKKVVCDSPGLLELELECAMQFFCGSWAPWLTVDSLYKSMISNLVLQTPHLEFIGLSSWTCSLQPLCQWHARLLTGWLFRLSVRWRHNGAALRHSQRLPCLHRHRKKKMKKTLSSIESW